MGPKNILLGLQVPTTGLSSIPKESSSHPYNLFM